MVERTTVIGRLGREPVKRSTPKGEVTGFSLAQSSRVLGPDGRWSDGPTTWYEVSAWDGLAQNAVASLRKGQPVIVHGVVFTNEWTGRDGETRRDLSIRAAAIGHDLNGGTATFERAVRPAATASSASTEASATTEEPGWGTPMTPVPSGAAEDGWHTVAEAEPALDAPF